MLESKLYLWSREDGQDGHAIWEQCRIIELDALLSVEALSTERHIVGCADSVGDIFLQTRAGNFSVNLKSRQVKELGLKGHGFGISVPVVSFCTPALGAAFTGEGSGVGASSA
ncbi:unnamed protein product [Urochloa humidicola]